MKKSMRFFSLATLVAMGAIFASCAKVGDDKPQENNSFTLTTSLSFDEEAATRALAVDFTNKTATKTFAVGDQVAVFYKDVNDLTKRVLSDALTIDDIHNDGKTADFTIDVSSASPGDGAQLRYVYPANMAQASIDGGAEINDANTIDYTNLELQTGDLDYLGSTVDLATFDGNFSGTSLPASATLTNRLAILALTLKNSDGTSIITSGLADVIISGSGTNVYNVSPKAASTFGQDVIFVAIEPEEINLRITANDGTYHIKTLTSRTYAAGNFYNLPVRMTVPAVGQVICTDGNFYTKAEAEAASKTPVAIVAYVGSETCEGAYGFTHGLALAMSDAPNGYNYPWGPMSTVSNKVRYASDSFGPESGLQYNDASFINDSNDHRDHTSSAYPAFVAAMSNNSTAAPTGCSAWFLPSAYQWKQMITAAGGHVQLREMAGLDYTAAQGYYWTSTETGTSVSLRYYFGDGNFSHVDKSSSRRVRSCLAF